LSRARLLSAYYLGGTLVFACLDWVLHAPVRAAFLGRPGQRMVYYAVLLGLGLLVRQRPSWAAGVGTVESATNVALIVFSIMLPVWSLSDQVEAGGAIAVPFTSWTLIGALLSGAVFAFSFQRHQRALFSRTSK